MAGALIVHAHPEPKSFSSSLKDITRDALSRKGYSVEISDLYQEAFQPVESAGRYPKLSRPDVFSPLREQRHAWTTGNIPADVEREIGRLGRADLVVFHFPLWWHAQPAILKGWFDRVFLSGGLYTSTKRYDRGHFRGRRAVAAITTGAPRVAFGHNARGGDMSHMLWPFHYSLHYMGFSVLPPFVAHGVQGHGYSYATVQELDEQLKNRMHEWRNRLSSIEDDRPIWFPGWADWDENGVFEGHGTGSHAIEPG